MAETSTSIFPLKSEAKNWTVNRLFTRSTRLTQILSYKERKKELCFVALFQTPTAWYLHGREQTSTQHLLSPRSQISDTRTCFLKKKKKHFQDIYDFSI